MHAIRLLNEGLELMERGTITLPRPERERLIEIRSGKWRLEQVVAEAKALIASCEEAQKNSPLATTVDREKISRTVAAAYRQHWAVRENAAY
jgi:hypothetical protein